MGYHPGAEDDGIYLTAVKADLSPALFPHDAAFFQLQMRTSTFDTWMAHFVQGTGIPLAWSELLWQALSIILILWACWSIICRLFPENTARWAGVALVGTLFTMPVAGTALYIFDQHLHPRSIATALILWAVVLVLDRRIVLAGVLLAAAVVLHPIMGVFGLSYCAILSIALLRARTPAEQPTAATVAMGIAPTWIFEGPSPAWKAALNTRDYYFIARWAWYEWLGAVAPIFILWLIARYARRSNRSAMSMLAGAATVFATFQLAVACIVLLTPALVRITPMQPMRYLHLVYIFMALLGGGLIGEKLLRDHLWRWVAFFLPLALGMFIAQRSLFAGTEHIELPGVASHNPWLRAFAWVRGNTPVDAYFALDPYYMQLPGEDYHSFRALAQRSELADAIKDAAVATQVPDLAPLWQEQTQAVTGWRHFQKQDFLRLRERFRVDWVIVQGPGVAGLDCPYKNEAVAVCRLQ